MSDPQAQVNDAPTGSHAHGITWFTVFYDLTMAAAISRAGDLLFVDHSWSNTFLVFGGTLIVFALWLLTTLLTSVASDDPTWRKLLLLVQLLLVIVAALATGAGGLENWVGFIAIAGALLITAALYWSARTRTAATTRQLRRLSRHTGIVVAIFVISAIVTIPSSSEQDSLWIPVILFAAVIALLFATLGGFLGTIMRERQLDLESTQSRFEDWILILIGEMAAGLIVGLSNEGTIPSVGLFVLTFFMTFAVWVVYILGISPSGIPRHVSRLRLWIVGHGIFLFSGVAAITSFQMFIGIDFRVEYVDRIMEWSPLPIVGIFVSVLVVTASQHSKGRRDTTLPHMDTASGRRLMARLRQERQSVLGIQYLMTGLAVVLWVLYYIVPITGMPWYSVLGAFLLVGNAIALGVIGRVR